MNREELLIYLVCRLWPILKPALEKAAESTEMPIDNWLVEVLNVVVQGVCSDRGV